MNISPERKRKLTKWLIGIATVCILIFLGVQNIGSLAKAFYFCADIVMPLIIGCGIALIVNVPMDFFERNLWTKTQKKLLRKIRRPIAFILALVLVFGIFTGVVAIVLPTLIDTVYVIVDLAVKLVNNLNSMSKDELAELPFGEMIKEVNWTKLIESAKSWLANSALTITNKAFGTITSLLSGIIDMFVSLVFASYILFGKERLARQFKHLVKVWLPEKFGNGLTHAASLLKVNFKSFIFAQFFEAVILGLLCFIGMLIFKFPYAAMISVLVGVTALIPIVGGFIGGGVGAFMMLAINPMEALWFLVFFIVLQQIEGNLIYPNVMGSRVNLPGMWILVAVTIGGGIGGPVGMLLSVPLASTAYALFKEATSAKESHQNDA